MTLRRRLVFLLGALLLWLVVTAGVGLWGVNGLKQDYSVALQNYEQLRLLYQVGFHLSSARQALATGYSDVGRAQNEMESAVRVFDQFAGADASTEIDAVKQSLRAARDQIKTSRGTAVDLPLSKLSPLVERERNQIIRMQQAADERRTRTLWLLAIVSAMAVGGAVVVGNRLYRAVMGPLSQLGQGVRQMGTGTLPQPIQLERADREFNQVAGEFNQMSAQLQTLYENLNQRVASATRQLVQSEKLAGVGYLAAGVAHEMNNPLAILLGYCELWQTTNDPATAGRTIQIARDEAQRCKAIVEKLLSLARQSPAEKTRVDLSALATEIVHLQSGLAGTQTRDMALQVIPGVVVNAVESELRQVILNLLVNALSATSDKGRVLVKLQSAGPSVELVVQDDGRGMTGDELSRIFEPFYTTSHGQVPRGTGLGLSISQAIIQSHGGVIEAHSDGPGKGSTFTIRLPTA